MKYNHSLLVLHSPETSGLSSDVCMMHSYLVYDLFYYFLMIQVAIPILVHFNVL